MIFQLGLLFLLIGLSSARSPLARKEIGSSKSLAADFLLPNNLTVELYQLELEPNFVTDTFIGSVSITFTTHINAFDITVHTYQLTINVNAISLLDANGNSINTVIGTTSSNDNRQFYTVHFAQSLIQHQTYTLVFGSFSGILNENNDGFYLARYINENNEVVKLATTQFEATSARRAFPSFDEPRLKAQFDIAIIRTSFYNSISNMPLVETIQITPGRFRDAFARTVRMSTYLIAFVISDWPSVGDGTHRVFARPQAILAGRGSFALGASIGILDAIAEFVDVPYTLPKMDQVGMSDNYFSAGAMENWGLVIYREQYLMYINNVSTSSTRENIATIIAHEYGHQWFGNLVSPYWWTYLWLNEGFATYFEFYGASVYQADMDLMDQIVVKSVEYALDRDNTATTRPMNLEAGSPSDISSLFDVVAYDKSGAVIRMVEGILSTPVFRRGLNIYLNNLQFDAAQPTDLYAGWQDALDEFNLSILPGNATVETVLTTWDSNPGYPLLTVTRNYQTGNVTFSQRRFISTNPNNDYENLWYIPITYATPTFKSNFTNTTIDLWLTTRNSTVSSLPGLTVNDWLVVNLQQKGYYRVNYDTENWVRIASFLNTDGFLNVHKTSRAQLIQDVFHFARYGIVDYQIALNLSRFLVRETDYIPIYPFISALSFLYPYFASSQVFSGFQNYTLTLLNAAYNSVGTVEYESDRHVTKLNRVNVLTWVCRFDGGNCRSNAIAQLSAWRNNSNNLIPPNLQSVISCAALTNGSLEDWDFVYQQYVSSSEAVVRSRLLSALGCSENPYILERFLDIVVNVTSNFPFGDRLSAFSSVYSAGNFGRDFAFGYIRQNINVLQQSFTQAQLSSIVNGIASRFSNAVQLSELLSFSNSVNGGFSIFFNAINSAVSNLVWVEQNLSSALSWFAEWN